MGDRTALFWMFGTLFFLKLLWNFSLPYCLIYALIRDPKREKASTSPMPGVEIILLVIIVAVSSPVHEQLGLSYLTTAAYGVAAIVISYLHMFVVSFVILGVLSMFKKEPSDGNHDEEQKSTVDDA